MTLFCLYLKGNVLPSFPASLSTHLFKPSQSARTASSSLYDQAHPQHVVHHYQIPPTHHVLGRRVHLVFLSHALDIQAHQSKIGAQDRAPISQLPLHSQMQL